MNIYIFKKQPISIHKQYAYINGEREREREGDREFTSLPHNQIHPNIYIYIYESKEEVSCLEFDWHGGVQVVKQRFGLAIFPIAQRMAIP